MRALKVLVVVMGVMIVAGVAVLLAVIAQRVGGGGAGAVASAVLSEPAGSRIAGSSLGGDRLALQVQGGGPDRVVVLDLRSGKVVARAALSQ